jgi:D-alanine-D-alanine ligase
VRDHAQGRAMTTSSSTATLTVAVLAGGRSSEHEVSLSSAASVRDGLLAGGHEVQWVHIGEDGAWRHDGRELQLRPGAGLLGADVAFPVLHGPFGEDGTVQGLLETLDVAYVGAGVTASALCMNKVLFKRLLRAAGDVPQVRFVGVEEERFGESPAQVREQLAPLGLPVFVKPAHLGSSLGIARVDAAAQMDDALEAAFAHDGLVIVEAMAGGVEVECAVLGALTAEREAGAGAAIASDPGEIILEGGWYDFASKYSPGGMQLHVPARISQGAAERVRELAVRVFAYTGCEGLARVDFFVDGEQVLVNELNTMPGFTPTSVYAKLVEHAGIAYPELVERLCRLALERRARERAHRH